MLNSINRSNYQNIITKKEYMKKKYHNTIVDDVKKKDRFETLNHKRLMEYTFNIYNNPKHNIFTEKTSQYLNWKKEENDDLFKLDNIVKSTKKFSIVSKKLIKNEKEYRERIKNVIRKKEFRYEQVHKDLEKKDIRIAQIDKEYIIEMYEKNSKNIKLLKARNRSPVIISDSDKIYFNFKDYMKIDWLF